MRNTSDECRQFNVYSQIKLLRYIRPGAEVIENKSLLSYSHETESKIWSCRLKISATFLQGELNPDLIDEKQMSYPLDYNWH